MKKDIPSKLVALLHLINKNKSVTLTAEQLGKSVPSISQLFKYYGYHLKRVEDVHYEIESLGDTNG